MKKMSKVLAIIMCLALVVTAFAACSNGGNGGDSQVSTNSGDSSNTGTDTPEYYKCAYLGPMTGESAQYGEVHTRAYQFAIDQINEAGGINGVPIKMDIYDDKNDAKEAVTVANKIVLDDEVLICFGPFASTVAIAVAPVFEKAGITECSPSASHVDFEFQGEYMVTGSNNQNYMQTEFAKFVYNDLGLKTTGMLCLNDDVGNNTIEVFTKEYEALGGTVTKALTYNKGSSTDFTPQISSIMQDNPECFYPYGTYAEVAQIAIQARQLDFMVPMISHDSMMKDEFLSVGGDNVECFLLLTGADPNLDYAPFQEFKAAFTEKYGDVTIDSHTLHCYDQMNMFAEALREYGPDRAKINSYMRDVTDYEGVSSTYSVIGGRPQKPMFPLYVKDGTWASWTKDAWDTDWAAYVESYSA